MRFNETSVVSTLSTGRRRGCSSPSENAPHHQQVAPADQVEDSPLSGAIISLVAQTTLASFGRQSLVYWASLLSNLDVILLPLSIVL